MRPTVIDCRNPHQGLSEALYVLDTQGVRRDSRNGPVLQHPGLVVTHYSDPLERVVFWPQRDANPFLHLAESLWMLAGRNDLGLLMKYTKQFEQYSDDGRTIRGSAYGHRWKKHWQLDQLSTVISMLKEDPDGRRAVLAMHDPMADLGVRTKDAPCNLAVTLQRDKEGRLDMTVFCRSNDIIWGTYGSNAVHFSFLQEYVALAVGCPVGSCDQVSVNWHGYLQTLGPVKELPRAVHITPYDTQLYGKSMVHGTDSLVAPLLMSGTREDIDQDISVVLRAVDSEFPGNFPAVSTRWGATVYRLLRAHHSWKNLAAPERFHEPLAYLSCEDPHTDFVEAARQWLLRRHIKWRAKMDQPQKRWQDETTSVSGETQ